MSEKMSEKYYVRLCKVCNHPNREQIDELLIEGLRSGREIARTYGLNENSISIHKRKHLIGNIREKLREIIKESIMDGLKPESTSDLVKLMSYVQEMENDEFVTGKKEWDIKKKEMFDKFKSTINGFMFRDLSDYDKNVIIRIAEDIFVRESSDKVGDLLRAYLDMPNPNIGQ